MRKVKVGALLTLDGVHDSPRSFADPWFDDEAAAKSLENLNLADAMMMGRTTYDYFAPAWSVAEGAYAQRVNEITKYVFTSRRDPLEWSNAVAAGSDPVATVASLKSEGDGDLVIYGLGRLARTLIEHDLVDQLDLWIFPVLRGSGTPLFTSGPETRLRLASVDSRPSGTVNLSYARG